MCTVLLRFDPTAPWPVLFAAVRDEFVDRAWQPPGGHWSGRYANLIGGRDLAAGGTWLAVDPKPKAVAAILNGLRLPPRVGTAQPSRGRLPLDVLSGQFNPTGDFRGYDGFHLVRASLTAVDVWSWDGAVLVSQRLEPGDHILVNDGVNPVGDPLVPHFQPLLAATPSPDPLPDLPSAEAWGDWVRLLAGDGLDPEDPKALLVRRTVGSRTYGSTSASLVGLSPSTVRYDFSAMPMPPAVWTPVE